MDSMSYSGSCSEFDYQMKSADDDRHRRRSASTTANSSYPQRIVRSLSSTIAGGRSPERSTTPAQLRAATVRGGISASEEQGDVARAQRERNALRYQDEEAVRMGNDAASVRSSMADDYLFPIDYGNALPPMQVISTESMGSSGGSKSRVVRPVQQQSVVSDGSSSVGRAGSKKVKISWNSMQSVKSTFLSKRRTSNSAAEATASNDNDNNDRSSSLEERVLRMKKQILMESHDLSGALLDFGQDPDPKARERVRLIAERPDAASAYIRMGLESDPDMDSAQMARMLDYYCSA